MIGTNSERIGKSYVLPKGSFDCKHVRRNEAVTSDSVVMTYCFEPSLLSDKSRVTTA